jgi:hypothetical protein
MAMMAPQQLAAWLLCFCACTGTAFAQALQSNPDELKHPRVEVFAGYSYWHPMHADISNIYFQDEPYGAEGSVTYFLKPWFGIQAEGGTHSSPLQGWDSTGGLGVQFQTNVRRFTPFFHALGGVNYFGGPAANPKHLGWNGTAGVGMDWVPSLRHEWFGIRLFQADYQYNHNDFGPLQPSGRLGGIAKMDTLVGSGGLVLRLGGRPHAEMNAQMSCSANRVEVFAGDAVSISSQVLGFSVMKPIQYTWTTSGGRLVGSGGESINIDTIGLPVGDYRVMGTAAQGSHASQRASCNAGFTIRSYEPPTVSCEASPKNISPGRTSTVTANGVSPQGRPLTYTFTSSSGTVNATGNIATVSASAPGDITVTCGVRDDLQHSASTTTTITVGSVTTTSTLPPLPLQSDMCPISFTRDRRRPARVNNEAKACLDDIALAMQHQQEGTLVLLGDHTKRESIALAAERAVNVKQYLTQEKGIDPARIQVRATNAGSANVMSVFLPVGAAYNEEGRVVNERAVVHHSEAYGRPRVASPTRTHRRTPRKAARRRR